MGLKETIFIKSALIAFRPPSSLTDKIKELYKLNSGMMDKSVNSLQRYSYLL